MKFFYFLATYKAKKKVVISYYENNCEQVITLPCRSITLIKISHWLEGYDVFSKISNVTFERLANDQEDIFYQSN